MQGSIRGCRVWQTSHGGRSYGGTRNFQPSHRGETPVVYGHWNNADLDAAEWPRPRIAGNTIGIDTVSHGVLTAIRIPDRRVFQSGRHNW